jgi:hypothetical protein
MKDYTELDEILFGTPREGYIIPSRDDYAELDEILFGTSRGGYTEVDDLVPQPPTDPIEVIANTSTSQPPTNPEWDRFNPTFTSQPPTPPEWDRFDPTFTSQPPTNSEWDRFNPYDLTPPSKIPDTSTSSVPPLTWADCRAMWADWTEDVYSLFGSPPSSSSVSLPRPLSVDDLVPQPPTDTIDVLAKELPGLAPPSGAAPRPPTPPMSANAINPFSSNLSDRTPTNRDRMEGRPADPYAGLPPDLVRNMSSIGLRHRGEEDLPEIPLIASLKNVNELSSGLIGGSGSLVDILSFGADKMYLSQWRDFLGNVGTWFHDKAQEQAVWGRNLGQDEFDPQRPPTFVGNTLNAFGSSLPLLLLSLPMGGTSALGWGGAGAMKLGTTASSWLPQWLRLSAANRAAVMLALSDAAGEAGKVQNKILRRGGTPEQAASAANKVFMANAAVNLPLEMWAGTFSGASDIFPGLKGWLWGTGVGALAEYYQEPTQDIISAAAEKPTEGPMTIEQFGSGFAEEFQKWDEYKQESGPAAAASSVLMSLMLTAIKAYILSPSTQQPPSQAQGTPEMVTPQGGIEYSETNTDSVLREALSQLAPSPEPTQTPSSQLAPSSQPHLFEVMNHGEDEIYIFEDFDKQQAADAETTRRFREWNANEADMIGMRPSSPFALPIEAFAPKLTEQQAAPAVEKTLAPRDAVWEGEPIADLEATPAPVAESPQDISFEDTNKVIDRFYEVANRTEKARNGYAMWGRGTAPDKDAKFAKLFSQARRKLSELNQTRTQIQQHASMSPQKKREKMDEIEKRAVQLARRALASYDK